MSAGRNPATLVEPGTRREIELHKGLRAWVIRGAQPGPIVWAWVPRGARDPSMTQALMELGERLDPLDLRGALGLIPQGPPPPLGRAPYPYAAAARALCSEAAALVLLSSPPEGLEATPQVALALQDRAARVVARALGARFLTPQLLTPPLNAAILTAPTVMWIDGEGERLCRPVIDRARAALESLLARLGMAVLPRAQPEVRVVLKAVSTIQAGGAGVVEPLVQPGALVRAGELVAWMGSPGGGARRALLAPATGVVLYLRTGRMLGDTVLGVGKLRRALPKLQALGERSPPRRVRELGWCERVGLPELGVPLLKAKIDTGARTSALHVRSRRPIGRDPAGRMVLEIEISAGARRISVTRVTVIEQTIVRDSGGHAERRPVIETTLRLGEEERRIRVSLTDRGDMRFPMLVGRTALPAHVRIHPGRRYLLDARR